MSQAYVVSLHSDFWTRAYWKTSSQTEKCPQPLIWTSASCDYFFFLPKATTGGGVSCWYLLSTFTVDSDVSWTFIGMMYSMVKQRPDSSPAKERDRSEGETHSNLPSQTSDKQMCRTLWGLKAREEVGMWAEAFWETHGSQRVLNRNLWENSCPI